MTPFTDIFKSDFTLPERVCVLAPGPNGTEFHSAIPEDCFTIAVAKSALVPGVSPDV